jgi:hypothetical protein
VANPLSRRLLWLAGLLSLLLIAVVVNYLVHDGSEVVNPIAEAAQRTAAMPGAKLKIELTFSSESSSRTVSGSGTGNFDGHTGRSDARMTVALPDGRSVWIQSVGDSQTFYTRSSEIAEALPPGKQWLEMQPMLGRDPQKALGQGAGAEGMLEELKATGGGIEEVGHQSVSGHPTTRYKASISPAQMAETLSEGGHGALAQEYENIAEQAPDPIQVEVWIDGHGLTRLVDTVQKLPLTSGTTIDMETRMEFFAFGHKAKIPLPPQHTVLDYTPVMRAELGMMDGHSFGSLTAPAGAKPLTAAAFSHRVRGMCAALQAQVQKILPRDHELISRFKGLDRSDLESGAAKPLLQATGRWIEGFAEGIGRSFIRRSVAVAPPAKDAADYRRYLTLSAQELEYLLAEARVYQLGGFKVPGADDHKAEEKKNEAELKKLAATLGIPSCEARPEGAGSGDPA